MKIIEVLMYLMEYPSLILDTRIDFGGGIVETGEILLEYSTVDSILFCALVYK